MSSRRWSGDWGRDAHAAFPAIEVLLPTSGRTAELAVTLAGLAGQDDPPFRVLIGDQAEDPRAIEAPAVQAMLRVLRAQGREVRVTRHMPRRGIAEHRAFLLEQSTADAVLLLDDDIWLEPGLLQRMHRALDELGCGFVGSAMQGLSFLDDRRPHQQTPFSPWLRGVHPERLRIGSSGTERWTLHNAANLVHIAAGHDLERESWLPYRVAWVAGCVLFRREHLVATGGFDFWRDLPPDSAGEDVVVQWRVMERFGGAGLLPSGAVHLEAPTSIPDRRVDAPEVVFGAERAS